MRESREGLGPRLPDPFPGGRGLGTRLPLCQRNAMTLSFYVRLMTFIALTFASGSKVHVDCFACSNSGGVEHEA